MIVVFNVCDRYLVPRDLSVGHFIHILSSRLSLPPGKALFVFVKNTLPQTGKPNGLFTILFLLVVVCLNVLCFVIIAANMMDSVYRSFKDEDGFLYMYYSTEKTFGSYIM